MFPKPLNWLLSALATQPNSFSDQFNASHYLVPFNENRPHDNHSICPFIPLPNDTHNDYKHLDPHCANDIDIASPQMTIESFGLHRKLRTVMTGQVTTALGRKLCLDNIKRIQKDGKTYEIKTDPVTISITQAEHHFSVTNGYSRRHANIQAAESVDYYKYIAHWASSDGDMCNWATGRCYNDVPEEKSIVWCHRQCAEDMTTVYTRDLQVTALTNDCVTLFDVNPRPQSLIQFNITKNGQSRQKWINTGLASPDQDIHRVQTTVQLSSKRLIEYQGQIYDGSDVKYNSKSTNNLDNAFGYNCASIKADNYKRVEEFVPWGNWGPRYATLGGNQWPDSSKTDTLQAVDGGFQAFEFQNQSVTAYGGQDMLVTYYFTTTANAIKVYEMTGAIGDFDCYFQGSSIDKVTGFVCQITQVPIQGNSVLRVYRNDSCLSVFSQHTVAQVGVNMTLPVIFFGQNVTMTVCTEIGKCKSYLYSTENKHIDPYKPSHIVPTDNSWDWNWDWSSIGGFFKNIFHAIAILWTKYSWYGKMATIFIGLILAVVAYYTLKVEFKWCQIAYNFLKGKHKKYKHRRNLKKVRSNPEI